MAISELTIGIKYGHFARIQIWSDTYVSTISKSRPASSACSQTWNPDSSGSIQGPLPRSDGRSSRAGCGNHDYQTQPTRGQACPGKGSFPGTFIREDEGNDAHSR